MTQTAIITAGRVCGRRCLETELRCQRPHGHYGSHRDHPRLAQSTLVWYDSECAPEPPRG